jgi:AcrR family transcriptional regulator
MYQHISVCLLEVRRMTVKTSTRSEKGPDSAKKTRRTQEERRAETRARLIDATIKLLHKKGAAKTTTAKVAEAAGVTRGAIQYHFSSPAELLRATVNEISHRLGQHMDVAKLKTLPLPDRINNIVDQYWKGFGSNTYTAFIEMAVGNRLEHDLGSAIQEALVDLEGKRVSMWLDLFADCPRSEADLLTWRATLLTSLRGLALTKMITSPKNEKNQLNQFKEMFRLYLNA